MVSKQITQLKKYVALIKAESHRAWEVPIVNKFTKDEYFAQASVNALAKKFNIPASSFSRKGAYREDFENLALELNTVLAREGVLVKRVIASALEIRRVTKLWWMNLSNKEKQDVETFGNTVRFKKYIKNWRGGESYEILKDVANEINQEMIELGLLKDDYLSVKERDIARDKEYRVRLSQGKLKWDELGAMPIEHYSEFVVANSSDEPYVQLKQLAALVRAGCSSESSKSTLAGVYKHLCQFLVNNNIPSSTTLEDILGEFFLIRFKQDYILKKMENGEISNTNAPTIISGTRKLLRRAIQLKGLEFSHFHDVELKAKGRSTDSNKPYSKFERNMIHEAIQRDMRQTLDLLKPYKMTGVGEYPLEDNGNIKPGYANIENAQYLFESYLRCKPVGFNTANTKEELGFIKIINALNIGLNEVYSLWGVPYTVDANTLSPFVFRLAQITGMNSEPLFNLEIDDFVPSHETTQKPCLRYWKERSSGEKELMLDLFNAKLQWLSEKQGKEVKDIFDNVISLTKDIRSEAPESVKDKLFVFKSSGRATHGEIRSFSDLINSTTNLYRSFKKRHDLLSEDGEPLVFNVSRFRPTFVSELLEAGVSLREIQLVLGHSNIETTVNYLDSLDFNRISRTKLNEALQKIHSRTIVSSSNDETPNTALDNPERIIFSTPLAGCANIFSPPDFVKKLSSYKDGQACSNYNKCLSCENVMITENHLPMLFAMKRDYLLLMQRNRIMDTPYGYVIEENLSLLDEVLNPKKSEFGEEDLKLAEQRSIYQETAIIDGVTL